MDTLEPSAPLPSGDPLLEAIDQIGGGRSRIGLDRVPDERILTKEELARTLGCSGRTLQRMADRFEIPPPTPLSGQSVWIAGKVKAWIADAATLRESQAKKEARRLRV